MWIRSELKSKAKTILKKKYWHAFLMSLVLIVANFNMNGSNSRNTFNSHNLPSQMTSNEYYLILIISAVFALLIWSCLRVLIGFPLEIGARRYFNRLSQNLDTKECVRFAFKGSNYKNIVLTMFLRNIKIILWLFLFIIPGIIKSFAYCMVPFILADNPDIGYKRAIRLSDEMTNGHKFQILILGLSFLGWMILGFMALFIGIIFVLPYINVTFTELYLFLRKEALDKGLCTPDELKLNDEKTDLIQI